MKLRQLRVRNFRGYKTETTINFNDTTALIGKNDAGKSTVMDALDIFFNDGAPDKSDASKGGIATDVAIICVFDDLPNEIVLDQTEVTTLESEHLLNNEGKLEIHKIFNGALEKPKLTGLHLFSQHPTATEAIDLMRLSNQELKLRAQQVDADTSEIDKKINSALRLAIRTKITNLNIGQTQISLMEGNGQNVWKGIQKSLPTFALFKSDRASTDQDSEAQDPLNAAIKEALKQKESELNLISQHIQDEVKKIADLTLRKIQEMDPTLASTLTPQFSTPKWASLFKASITGDADIPINKRGSGVRRLILLNFFRAKAERRMSDDHKQNAIYAIEEPETSQHPRNQRLLVSALQELAGRDQVILTTHTPMLARSISSNDLRFVYTAANGEKIIIEGGSDSTNKVIADSLGVLPDHTVKLFIGIEGKHDIPFLKNMSRLLLASGEQVPNLEQLETDGEIIFTPLGGSALALWCNRLSNLNRPEFHIYDRDTQPPTQPKYQRYADEVNMRVGCKAMSTSKREMENYIHVDAINMALSDIGIPLVLNQQIGDFDDLPTLLVNAVNPLLPQSDKWGGNRAKDFLCNLAASKMTKAMLDHLDPSLEVLGWFSDIQAMLNRPL